MPAAAPAVVRAGYQAGQSNKAQDPSSATVDSASDRFLAAARAARVRDRLIKSASLDPSSVHLSPPAPSEESAPDDAEHRIVVRISTRTEGPKEPKPSTASANKNPPGDQTPVDLEHWLTRRFVPGFPRPDRGFREPRTGERRFLPLTPSPAPPDNPKLNRMSHPTHNALRWGVTRMRKPLAAFCGAMVLVSSGVAGAAGIRGDYVEARTADRIHGPVPCPTPPRSSSAATRRLPGRSPRLVPGRGPQRPERRGRHPGNDHVLGRQGRPGPRRLDR